jgi:hypothetical protein
MRPWASAACLPSRNHAFAQGGGQNDTELREQLAKTMRDKEAAAVREQAAVRDKEAAVRDKEAAVRDKEAAVRERDEAKAAFDKASGGIIGGQE